MGHFITRDGLQLYVHDDGKVYGSQYQLDKPLAENEAEAVAVFFDKKPRTGPALPEQPMTPDENSEVAQETAQEPVINPLVCVTCGFEAGSIAGLAVHKRRHRFEVT